jgi:drug/metabolite transporter (DMT)-like permease
VVTAAACFGTLGPISNLAYEAGVTPTAFVFWRGAIGAAFLCGLLAVRHRAGLPLAGLRDVPSRQAIALGIATLAAVVLNLAIFSAFSRVPVALALLGFYTFPAMITLADVVVHGDRLDAPRLLALGLALTGIVLVLGRQLDAGAGPAVDVLGVGLAIVAAIGQTVYLLVGRHGFARVPTEQAMAVILVVSAACFLAVAALGGELAAALELAGRPAVWPFLAFAGILGAGVPSLLFLVGVRRLGGTRTAILALFEPVVGIGLAAIILGERLSPEQLMGGLLVLAAAVALQRRQMPAPAGPPVA